MNFSRVNIGCGATPTQGWVNFDNSLTVRLASLPLPHAALNRLFFLDSSQRYFLEIARSNRIRWANGAQSIPLDDGSAEVVYTSHMVEHLDPHEVKHFLGEVRRVLRPGGVLRVAVPDLARLVANYAQNGDANRLVADTLLAHRRPRGWRQTARFLLLGNRDHHWMYDGRSLAALLSENGFSSAREVPAGTTTIPEPGALDLYERSEESVYVEGNRD
jgi:predicted SAM-dependent methyltransferase